MTAGGVGFVQAPLLAYGRSEVTSARNNSNISSISANNTSRNIDVTRSAPRSVCRNLFGTTDAGIPEDFEDNNVNTRNYLINRYGIDILNTPQPSDHQHQQQRLQPYQQQSMTRPQLVQFKENSCNKTTLVNKQQNNGEMSLITPTSSPISYHNASKESIVSSANPLAEVMEPNSQQSCNKIPERNQSNAVRHQPYQTNKQTTITAYFPKSKTASSATATTISTTAPSLQFILAGVDAKNALPTEGENLDISATPMTTATTTSTTSMITATCKKCDEFDLLPESTISDVSTTTTTNSATSNAIIMVETTEQPIVSLTKPLLSTTQT